MKTTSLLCVIWLYVLVLFVQHGHSQAPTQPRIAFTSRGDIWLIAPDGKNPVNLTKPLTIEWRILMVTVHLGLNKPSFSPPGHDSVASEGRLSPQCGRFGGQKLGFWSTP